MSDWTNDYFVSFASIDQGIVQKSLPFGSVERPFVS